MENVSARSTHTRHQADELQTHPEELEAWRAALSTRLERLTVMADRERGAVSPHLAEQLRHVSERVGRDPAIEQAKLVLRERYAITGAEAFEILRRVSQTSNRKLRDVARDVLANVGEP